MIVSPSDVLPDCRADFDQRVAVDTTALAWESSPSGTVWRKPLYRMGGEHGPVTSLVRYAPGGSFRPHFHPEGEEILVLAGVFADEHGHYPAGTYLLNPDGSHHSPRSDPGCLLFVRLRQYPGANRPRVVLDTTTGEWRPGPAPGILIQSLYSQIGYPEQMHLERWMPGTTRPRDGYSGREEILVLAGELCDEWGVHGLGSWLRYPSGDAGLFRSAAGCQLYVRVVLV